MTNAEQTAPRAATVFALMTDPSRIAEWWGPHGVTTVVEEMDVRPGGKWRFLSHHPGGEDHGFRGEYREVTPPEVLVQTFEWMGLPGHVSVETARFEEIDGRTDPAHGHLALRHAGRP